MKQLTGLIRLKIAIVIFILSTPVIIVNKGFTQDVEMEWPEKKAHVRKIIDVPNKSASELYSTANNWITTVFTDPEQVIVGKIENELIKGKVYQPKVVKLAGTDQDLSCNFQIEVKDNRVRFTVDGIIVSTLAGQFTMEEILFDRDGRLSNNPDARVAQESVTRFANDLFLSLENYALKKTQAKVKDDWR